MSASLPSRLGILAVAGMAVISFTACGSSDKSGGGAATASSQQFTTAQLDQAMKATTIDGQSLTVNEQSLDKESLTGAQKMRAELGKSLKISPAECEKSYSMAQLLNDGSLNIPVSMGSLNDGKVGLVAMQLPAHTPDKWDASTFEKCHEFTLSGTVMDMPVSGKATVSQVDVPATVASNPHGLVEVLTQNGKDMTISLGMARVGDVEIEAAHSGASVSGQQLAKELDALATQIKKLG